jgi:hypothetical protein
MAFFKDETNNSDVWAKEDLLQCTYEPGMTIFKYFELKPSLISARHFLYKSLCCPFQNTDMHHNARMF